MINDYANGNNNTSKSPGAESGSARATATTMRTPTATTKLPYPKPVTRGPAHPAVTKAAAKQKPQKLQGHLNINNNNMR